MGCSGYAHIKTIEFSNDRKKLELNSPLNNNIENSKNKLNNDNKKTTLTEETQNLKYISFYENYKQLFEDLKSLNSLLNNSIDSKNQSDDYKIISKKNYNYLIKLFESDSIFMDNNIIIDSYEKLTPINKLSFNNKNIQNRLNKYIYNDSFAHVEMIPYEYTNFKYINDFILIKKNLLLKFGIDEKIFKNNQYNIFFGEKYLFVEIFKNILICSRENFFFNTNIIISCLREKYFEKQLVPNIKGKKGFDYFFNKIGFDINKKQSFRHIIDEVVFSEIQIIKYSNEKTKEIKSKNEVEINQILKQIVISLYSIRPLKDYLANYECNNTDITSYLIKFIQEFKYKYDNGMNDIKEIETIMNNNKIKKNFKDIIEFILDNIHLRLGGTNFDEKILEEEGKDKNYIINVFKYNIKNNNTIIKNIFYGTILCTTTTSCCKEKIYKCQMSKYIYLNYEEIKNYNNLNDILQNWGITKNKDFLCGKCIINDEAEISKSFVEYPQILIIILNDENESNKKSIKFPVKLDIDKFSFSYKLICAITTQEQNDFNFKLIKSENNNWFLFDKIDKKITQTDFEIYAKYPRVLFYEKIKESKRYMEYSQTEEDMDNFFKNSSITNNFKKGLGYPSINSYQQNSGYGSINEYFNEYIQENILNLSQKKKEIKNFNEEEKKMLKEYIKNNNINLTKEQMENYMMINNSINDYKNQNNIKVYDDFSFLDGAHIDKSKNKFEPELFAYNIKNIQFNDIKDTNQNINNSINNNKSILIQNNIIYNQINIPFIPFNNSQMTKNNNKNNNENKIENSNDENNTINEKKEMKLTFLYNGYSYSLSLYNKDILFKEVIHMLRDQLPEIDEQNFGYLTQGIKIDINKSIKDLGIADGFHILIVKFSNI